MRAVYRNLKFVYHIISISLLIVSLLIGVLNFTHVFYRTWECIRDLGLSIAYYVIRIFGIDSVSPTVTQFPRDFLEVFPAEWAAFLARLQNFCERFISSANLLDYICSFLSGLHNFALVLLLLLPICLISGILLWLLIFKRRRGKESHGRKSRPLRVFLKVREFLLLPIKRFVVGYGVFLQRHKPYWIAALILWAYFLNIGTIMIELIAWYLYFSVSFDLLNIYVQFVKLVSDLAPAVIFFPPWIWLIVIAAVLDFFRRKIAYSKLEHYESKNREFLEDIAIVFLITGTMRSGKTSTMTDMQLSLQAMYRHKALEGLRDIDKKFPFFPWIRLEMFLKRAFRSHRFYSLDSISRFFRTLKAVYYSKDKSVQRCFLRKLRRRYHYQYHDLIFGYDDQTYPLEYNSDLMYENLFDSLKVYAQLYYIYLCPSLLIGNYAIRSDNDLEDEGNFPRRRDDFFKRPAARVEDSSMSHVLSQDMLRLGKRMHDDNPLNNAFEFGVIGITEAGKERGNQKTTEGIKKTDEDANQKNDLFNLNVKMIGHSGTVYFDPYVRIALDEQRPSSLNADLLQLVSIIDIVDRGENKIILPLFALEEAFCLIIDKLFGKLYDEYRYNRGDDTFTLYLLKAFVSPILHYYDRIKNRFSVSKETVTVEAGTMDEPRRKSKYYLMSKKIYSARFTTDCHHQFYARRASKSKFGLNDIPTYSSLEPTYDELRSQDSYFISDVTKAFDVK